MIADDALAGQGVLTAAVFEGSKLGFKRLLAVRNQGGQNPFHAAGTQRNARRVERLGRDGSLEVDTGKSVYLKIKQSGEGGGVHAGVAEQRKCCSSNGRQTAQKNAAAFGQRFFEISALETGGGKARLEERLLAAAVQRPKPPSGTGSRPGLPFFTRHLQTHPVMSASPQCWLVKQEPSAYSWTDFVSDGRTAWTGVRNFQARKNLHAMRNGDLALFYHSVIGKEIVGIARVVKEAYPDPTATEGKWVCVDLAPEAPLPFPVTLETLKAHPTLCGIPLIKQSRLSVMPLSQADFDAVTALGQRPS
jgi:predicted RNA-binding protein with PUA-like domain